MKSIHTDMGKWNRITSYNVCYTKLLRKINLDYGFDSVWLHSDEMLLYGCDNRDFVPNRDAIVDLWKGLKGLGANFIGTTHMTFSAVAADPLLMQQIRNNFV